MIHIPTSVLIETPVETGSGAESNPMVNGGGRESAISDRRNGSLKGDRYGCPEGEGDQNGLVNGPDESGCRKDQRKCQTRDENEERCFQIKP